MGWPPRVPQPPVSPFLPPLKSGPFKHPHDAQNSPSHQIRPKTKAKETSKSKRIHQLPAFNRPGYSLLPSCCVLLNSWTCSIFPLSSFSQLQFFHLLFSRFFPTATFSTYFFLSTHCSSFPSSNLATNNTKHKTKNTKYKAQSTKHKAHTLQKITLCKITRYEKSRCAKSHGQKHTHKNTHPENTPTTKNTPQKIKNTSHYKKHTTKKQTKHIQRKTHTPCKPKFNQQTKLN